jgi:Spy/CpxP family protein refolding chaperone
MRLCKFALTLGVIALVCSPALAQRGRGGFGRGGIGTLAQNKSVQEELKVKEDTATKIKDAITKVQEDNKDDLAKLRDQNTSREDRQAIGKKLNEAYTKSLKDILDTDQMKRLNQIVLQQEGLRVFQNESVQSALKMTDDQKTKIKGIADDLQKETAALRPAGGGRPSADDIAKGAALRKEAMTKAKDTLTGDQKKAFDDLLGKPFEVKFEGGRGGRGGKPRTNF